MSGSHNHCEIVIEDLRCPTPTCWAARVRGTCSASTASGPARLAHCMRWIGQAEIALDMTVKRASSATATGRTWPRSRASSG